MNNHIATQLSTIRDAFSLTNDEIAKVLKIDKETIYIWISNNTILKDDKRHNFFVLYLLAQEWLKLNYPTDKNTLSEEIVENETVLSSLSKFDKELTLSIGNILNQKLN